MDFKGNSDFLVDFPLERGQFAGKTEKISGEMTEKVRDFAEAGKERGKVTEKRVEKGGFLDLEEESLDLTAGKQPEKGKIEFLPPNKKADVPKPEIVDLEESDIML